MMELQTQAAKQDTSDMNRDPITGAPGAHPIGTGLGAASGALAGAAVGLMGGPVGTAVGGVVGGIVGGLAGKGVGEVMKPTLEEVVLDEAYPADDIVVRPVVAAPANDLVDPTAEDLYWQRAFITEPYYNSELAYDDYAPAYRLGLTDRVNNKDRTWEESEVALQSEWERSKGTSRLSWDDAKEAARAAWHRTNQSFVEPPLFEIH